jgi:hypothetical protein
MTGFMMQVVTISESYFTYDVRIVNEISFPFKLPIPGLSVCFRYGDIFDYDLFEEKYPEANITYEQGLEDDFADLSNIVTIEDLFEMTPNDEELYVSCSMRKPASFFLEDWEGDNCSKIFQVSKFYILNYICYRFNFTEEYDKRELSFEHIAFTLDVPGLIYEISLNETAFANADFLRIVIHASDFYPSDSIGFAPTLRRIIDKTTGKGKYNYFYIDFYGIDLKRLPSPYKTHCRKYGDNEAMDNQRACHFQCLTNGTKTEYKKVMFNDIAMFPIPMGHMTEQLYKQNQTLEFMKNLDDRCSETCKELSCYESLKITTPKKVPTEPKGLDFRVNSPKHMYYKTEYLPKLDFMDYFVYISSSFGIWFGISIFQINPFPLLIHTIDRQFKREKSQGRNIDSKGGTSITWNERRKCPAGKRNKRNVLFAENHQESEPLYRSSPQGQFFPSLYLHYPSNSSAPIDRWDDVFVTGFELQQETSSKDSRK